MVVCKAIEPANEPSPPTIIKASIFSFNRVHGACATPNGVFIAWQRPLLMLCGNHNSFNISIHFWCVTSRHSLLLILNVRVMYFKLAVIYLKVK
jgi:hypothetical protein